MAAPTSLLGVAERTPETALGFGIGLALARALEPLATSLSQEAWKTDTSKAVDAGTAGAIVAEDVRRSEWGAGEAAAHGIDGDRFTAIVGEILNAPGIAELLTMLRRGTIDEAAFVHGLRKAKQETRWDAPLAELKSERLDPAVIATAIQRGIIDDPGLLPVEPPSGTGRIAPMPRANVDALPEAAASGYDRERLAAITRIVGLPPGPGELMQLVNRGRIDTVDFHRGIAEGNTRNEWGDALLSLRRRLLTPHEYAELRLRAWIDDVEMHAGAALSGMTAADTDLLHKVIGRPLSFHQVFIGERRGGKYGGPSSQINTGFLKSLQESNIRREWFDLAWAQRYTYPSAFVLRALATDGAITGQELETIFLYEGWEPTLAKKVAAHYAKPSAGKSDPHVAKAETHLWNTLHKSYVDSETDAATAAQDLTVLGVAEGAQGQVLALWDRERAVTRRSLNPAQIKKAVAAGKWTRDEALTRLAELGYTAADAATLLDE